MTLSSRSKVIDLRYWSSVAVAVSWIAVSGGGKLVNEVKSTVGGPVIIPDSIFILDGLPEVSVAWALNAILLLLILSMISLGGYFIFMSSPSQETVDYVYSAPSVEVQHVILSEKNWNYHPSTVRVKAGKPVSITLDDSVKGCLRAFTINDLGVQKYAKTAKDSIDFTPKKPGTYQFSCSMGMGYGTLIVEEA